MSNADTGDARTYEDQQGLKYVPALDDETDWRKEAELVRKQARISKEFSFEKTTRAGRS